MKHKIKELPGYEGRYSIDDDGNIWSHLKSLWLKPTKQYEPNGDYYLRVGLNKDGVSKSFLVHRLVAEVYVANPENKPTVNHKDGNTSNNNKNNLEWATVREQRQHSINELNATERIQTLGYKCKNARSSYRGVTSGRQEGTWRAKFQHNKKDFNIGQFATEIEAAEAYDKAITELGFTHRPLNFPNKCPETIESTSKGGSE